MNPLSSYPLRAPDQHRDLPMPLVASREETLRCVLVADDDVDVQNLVALHLSAAGYRVLKAANGATALEMIRQHRPRLAVLDISMPEMDGLDVCRAIKSDARTAGVGVFILTARTSEVDRVLSFELGADDYLVKPFSPRELVLRIGSILRRRAPGSEASPFLQAGAITLDCERHEVRVEDERVELTAIEFKLLTMLMELKGRTLSRTTILETIWGFNTDVETRTVDTHLRRLRDKLGSAAHQVCTVRGFGYRLDSE